MKCICYESCLVENFLVQYKNTTQLISFILLSNVSLTFMSTPIGRTAVTLARLNCPIWFFIKSNELTDDHYL